MNAHETYEERKEEMIAKVWQIRKLLVVMDEVEEKTPQYWTHAGTLGYINEELNDIIRFMGGK